MDKTYFAIALHFHQPVGNFDEIFERVYERCYRPFLEYLPYYPDIKMTLHVSGSLMDYFLKSHPEIIELIKKLILNKQVEIIGGPYYEPILPAISERDIKGQIRLMSKSLKDIFNVRPRGMWVPERVWQPSLTKCLHKTGMRYSILDDTHLIKAGLKKEDTLGYFKTGGFFRNMAVFASDKKLRYLLPFKEPRESIEYIKNLSGKKRNPLFLYADDVEKFGEWPGTYDWVYKRGWLRLFFDTLMDNKAWLKTVKLSDYIKNEKPLARVNIPEASYDEMMEWSNGSWFNFLKKYPESKEMYDKMRYVSNKVKGFWGGLSKKGREAQHWANIELYKGECNCGYWHGDFGGLYMYHLRSAIYNHLIAAENIVDRARHKKKDWINLREIDFNNDGRNEFIAENHFISAYIDPKNGGVLTELDYRPICVNLIDTLSRKEEKYHKDIKESEPTLGKKLIYDKHERHCLRDYLFYKDIKKEDFTSSLYKDKAGLSSGEYTANKKKKGLMLKRNFNVSGAQFELSKDITFKDAHIIEVLYNIRGLGNSTSALRDFIFGVEFNLTMPFLDSGRYRYFSGANILGTLNKDGIARDTSSFEIRDSQKELAIRLGFSKKAGQVWYFPIETVSKSLTTYRANFQCSCIMPLWKLDLDKDGSWQMKLDWYIG